MLSDPLTLAEVQAGTTFTAAGTAFDAVSLRVIDPGANLGKTVRVGNVGDAEVFLTISHSETKENSPYGTKRTSVRLDLKTVDSEGRSVLTGAQCILIQPKGSVITSEQNNAVRRILGMALLFGDTTYFGSPIALTSGDAFFARITSGEG